MLFHVCLGVCAFQFILAFTIIIHTPVTYGDYVYPGWAIGIGWIFALCSIVPLPVIAVMKLLQAEGTLWEVRFTDDWGGWLNIYYSKGKD